MIKIYYAHTESPNGGFGVLGKGIKKMLENHKEFELLKFQGKLPKQKPDVIFTYGTPPLVSYIQQQRGLKGWEGVPHVHYAVWESSHIPPEHVIEYHRPDLMLTATEYTRRSFRYAGIRAKIWHHAVDERFQYREPQDDGVFAILHHNGYEYRKGTAELIEAFQREFSLDEPVKLVIKARERKLSVWLTPSHKILTPEQLRLRREDREEFLRRALEINHPLIEEKIGHISDEEMVQLNTSADLFAFPAKGEGWGLPPFEAMAMGIVPMVPEYGCFKEWVNSEYMLLLKQDGYLNTGLRYPGFMFNPSIKHMRKLMRYAFEHQDELKEMGKKGSEYIHANYNWEKVGDELYQILKENL